MAIVKTTVTLTDSLQAIKVDGLDITSIYLRVKKVIADTVPNGAYFDTVLYVRAYEVDSTGTPVPNSIVAPQVGTTVHQGGTDLTSALSNLTVSAIASFISSYQTQQMVNSVPDNLPLS